MKKLLFNPFEKYDGRPLLTFGLLATIIGSFLGYVFKSRYDGAFHISPVQRVEMMEPLTDNIFNIACLFFALYLFGYIINKKTRPIDILSTVMIARLPFYITTLSNINGFIYLQTQAYITEGPQALMENQSDLLIMTGIGFLILPFLVWYIALLYNGFKTAVNIKTVTHKLLFAVALIVAHILSGILFYILY